MSEDRKIPLEGRLEKLKGVTFHAKLGAMYERVERLQMMSEALAPRVGADPAKAVLAARLAKSDLTTGVVGEFPELQGVMGGYYATAEGLSPLVAEAIRDHYRPAGAGDEVPDRPVTMAVALADKLDTLIGFFAIGEKPTGSRDPFALRRAALGVIRIVLGSELRAPIRELVADWYRTLRCFVDPGRALWVTTPSMTVHLGAGGRAKSQEYEVYLREFDEALLDGGPQVVVMDREVDIVFDRLQREPPTGEILYQFRPYDEVVEEVVAFFADRLEVWLRDRGQRHDLVSAIFALGDDDLVRIVARVNALDAFLKTEDGANLLAGYKRAVNILQAPRRRRGRCPSANRSAWRRRRPRNWR